MREDVILMSTTYPLPAHKSRTHIGVLPVVALAVALFSALLAGGARSASPTAVHGANESQSAPGRAVSTSQPWDLLYISDSSGWGVAPLYARSIRQDRGVAVRVHDQWQGDLAAVTILERLRTPGDSWIRLIREAEVIVVYGNFTGLGIKGDDNFVSAVRPVARGPRYWQPYVATLKAISKRIFELRK